MHIGILDFTPNGFPKEFFSEYVFYSKKTGHVYSDKIGIYMLQLKQLGNPKDEKEMPDLYHWAQLFQATTWEEIKMLADNNEDMKDCVVTIKKLTADEKTRQQLEAREKQQRDMMSAKEFGYRTGLEEGREDGLERANRLIKLLLEQSRFDEIERAVSDKEYQKKLFEEFGL